MNLKIKSTVGLTKADVDKCLELLEEYRGNSEAVEFENRVKSMNILELEITPLMLKKNPHCVETMKRLRRYVGNLKEWKISDEEKLQFLEKAEKIRQKSESIYNNFKVNELNCCVLLETTKYCIFFHSENVHNSQRKILLGGVYRRSGGLQRENKVTERGRESNANRGTQ